MKLLKREDCEIAYEEGNSIVALYEHQGAMYWKKLSLDDILTILYEVNILFEKERWGKGQG